jgi:hypothetical protein
LIACDLRLKQLARGFRTSAIVNLRVVTRRVLQWNSVVSTYQVQILDIIIIMLCYVMFNLLVIQHIDKIIIGYEGFSLADFFWRERTEQQYDKKQKG